MLYKALMLILSQYFNVSKPTLCLRLPESMATIHLLIQSDNKSSRYGLIFIFQDVNYSI